MSSQLNPTYRRLLALEAGKIRLGLDRIRGILSHLNHPQKTAKQTVLIAGTNGKGSTSAMLSAMARAQGLKAGFFSSPHLAHVTERYRVNDTDITWDDFDRMGHRVLLAMEETGIELSHFEALATLAFLWFAASEVDIQFLEIGLGGTRDAMRVAHPSHAIVTSVALDHTELLGNTLEAIAREKLGVCAPGTEVVTGIPKSLWHLLPPAWQLGRDFTYRRTQKHLFVWGPFGTLKLPRPNLLGAHQGRNAAIASVMAHRLGFSKDAIANGLTSTRWPARMERFMRRPDTWLDGAHNPAAVTCLMNTFDEAGLTEGYTLVFAAHPKKDAANMLRRLAEPAGHVWLTTADRLEDPDTLAAHLSSRKNVHVAYDCWDALTQARALNRPVLVAGSIYLAGALMRAQSQSSEPK